MARYCDLQIIQRLGDNYVMKCARPDCGRTLTRRVPPSQVRLVCQSKVNEETREKESVPQAVPASGPGTELKALLATIGITASDSCKCMKRAKEMDERGVEWCDENRDEIAGWMGEEAEKRGIPFSRRAARFMVKVAVRRARKKAKKASQAAAKANAAGFVEKK